MGWRTSKGIKEPKKRWMTREGYKRTREGYKRTREEYKRTREEYKRTRERVERLGIGGGPRKGVEDQERGGGQVGGGRGMVEVKLLLCFQANETLVFHVNL